MDITHLKEGAITIVTVNGRLDATTAPVADKTIKKLLKRDCLRMIFDFSTLDYLSNGGLEVIMEATKELRRKEGLATGIQGSIQPDHAPGTSKQVGL